MNSNGFTVFNTHTHTSTNSAVTAAAACRLFDRKLRKHTPTHRLCVAHFASCAAVLPPGLGWLCATQSWGMGFDGKSISCIRKDSGLGMRSACFFFFHCCFLLSFQQPHSLHCGGCGMPLKNYFSSLSPSGTLLWLAIELTAQSEQQKEREKWKQKRIVEPCRLCNHSQGVFGVKFLITTHRARWEVKKFRVNSVFACGESRNEREKVSFLLPSDESVPRRMRIHNSC